MNFWIKLLLAVGVGLLGVIAVYTLTEVPKVDRTYQPSPALLKVEPTQTKGRLQETPTLKPTYNPQPQSPVKQAPKKTPQQTTRCPAGSHDIGDGNCKQEPNVCGEYTGEKCINE